MATVEQLLSRGTPTETLRVPLDGGVAAADLATARARLAIARQSSNGLTEAEAEVEAARDAVTEAEVKVAMRGLSRSEWRKLEDAHPPADEDVEAAKKLEEPPPQWGEGFPIALVAATMTDPELSLEDAQSVFDTWSAGDLAKLVDTAQRLSLNTQIGRAGKA